MYNVPNNFCSVNRTIYTIHNSPFKEPNREILLLKHSNNIPEWDIMKMLLYVYIAFIPLTSYRNYWVY